LRIVAINKNKIINHGWEKQFLHYIYIFSEIISGIVLKPGSARRVDPGLSRPGIGTRPGWRKNRVRKNPVWPSEPAILSYNPLTFVFLLKQRRFDLKKFWLSQPGDPVKTQNQGLEPGQPLSGVWKLLLVVNMKLIDNFSYILLDLLILRVKWIVNN